MTLMSYNEEEMSSVYQLLTEIFTTKYLSWRQLMKVKEIVIKTREAFIADSLEFAKNYRSWRES